MEPETIIAHLAGVKQCSCMIGNETGHNYYQCTHFARKIGNVRQYYCVCCLGIAITSEGFEYDCEGNPRAK